MNIVIISTHLPYPLSTGGAQAQYNMIDILRHRHQFHFIYPENKRNSKTVHHTLSKLWPNVKLTPYSYTRQLLWPQFFMDKAKRAINLSLRPNSKKLLVERTIKRYGYYFNKDFINFVNHHISHIKPDFVQIDFYPYLHLINYLPADVKTIFIHHEIRYIRNERLLSDIKLDDKWKRKMTECKQEEIDDLNKFSHIVTLTDIDRKQLLTAGVRTPISISPAAINTESLPYGKQNRTLTFVGSYHHFPNQEGIDWFIGKVLPMLTPDIPLHIIGKGWPMSYHQQNRQIIMEGFVSKLSDVIHGSLMVVPILSGSGMRMKILEAASLSVPFVTTSVGVEGLNFVHRVSCLIADTPESFAAAITLLLENNELRKELATNAHNVYEKEYSREALAQKREKIYLTISQESVFL